jgi:PPOX class probable F420-dependent enzyme
MWIPPARAYHPAPVEADEMRARVDRAAVARLATIRADGTPHLVPVCFALDEEATTAVSIVDRKPKRSLRLQRLENVGVHPEVCLLVDHYDDDWTQLWWVRIDGTATVFDDGAEHARAIELLAAKYRQYREQPATGAVLAIALERWVSWSSSG